MATAAQELRARYVVVDPKVDDTLAMLMGKAMAREPLGNVHEELKEIANEIGRLRTLAGEPKVSPEDQFRINLMVATGINERETDRIAALARSAEIDPKALADIFTGKQPDVHVRTIARLARALGTQPHVLMRGVTA